MSRIGIMPILIPEKVDVSLERNDISVKGPLGELSFTFHSSVGVKQKDNTLVVSQLHESGKALWGTTRSLIANMVHGVSVGYKKTLEINGVGYKFEIQGNTIILSIGYSHKVEMTVPNGIQVALDEKNKSMLFVTGIDKQKVGEFASKIRAKKKPEPYKGKGIKYMEEHIRRKAGKTGSK